MISIRKISWAFVPLALFNISIASAQQLGGRDAYASRQVTRGHYPNNRGDIFLENVTRNALRNSPVNVNLIRNRGNGIGNDVVAPVGPNKRININLISNAGNGNQNRVIAPGIRGAQTLNFFDDAVNGRNNRLLGGGIGDPRNGLNINVFKGVANGNENLIYTRNGR